MNNLINAIIFVLLLGALGVAMDGYDLQTTPELTEAQNDAQIQRRRELAAQAMCRELHGEGSFKFDSEGDVICLTKKGKK